MACGSVGGGKAEAKMLNYLGLSLSLPSTSSNSISALSAQTSIPKSSLCPNALGCGSLTIPK